MIQGIFQFQFRIAFATQLISLRPGLARREVKAYTIISFIILLFCSMSSHASVLLFLVGLCVLVVLCRSRSPSSSPRLHFSSLTHLCLLCPLSVDASALFFFCCFCPAIRPSVTRCLRYLVSLFCVVFLCPLFV